MLGHCMAQTFERLEQQHTEFHTQQATVMELSGIGMVRLDGVTAREPGILV